MDGNKHYQNSSSRSNGEYNPADGSISIEQLQRLVHLLDHSDVSEIELKHAKDGVHLVLRKAKVAAGGTQVDSNVVSGFGGNAEVTAPVETKHSVVSHLVGIFHPWAKPKGGTLVAIGDRVKVGQLVGTIQSLNVMNEVEAAVAGRVTEILVQDGQAVEYGQQLMTIDSTEGA